MEASLISAVYRGRLLPLLTEDASSLSAALSHHLSAFLLFALLSRYLQHFLSICSNLILIIVVPVIQNNRHERASETKNKREGYVDTAPLPRP